MTSMIFIGKNHANENTNKEARVITNVEKIHLKSDLICLNSIYMRTLGNTS